MEPVAVVYKQILLDDEAFTLGEYLMAHVHNEQNTASLATGLRQYTDVDLSDSKFKELVTDRLFVVLNDYFPGLKVDRWARFYNHQYGAVRPHYDVAHDGLSTHTLLLYLSEDFEGGRLTIKTKRPDEEREASTQPNHFHKVYTIAVPKRGYGVIFAKHNLHWADECVGDKRFLLVHLCNV